MQNIKSKSEKHKRQMSLAYAAPRQRISSVEATIISHLKSWGEYQDENCKSEMSINGHSITNIHIDQAYKGNYHLLANIGGIKRKFVIGKN